MSASQLGLVCITHAPTIRYRTLTLSRYTALAAAARPGVLGELYRSNLATLLRALDYCVASGIHLYRVTSALFPLSDLPDGVGESLLEAIPGELAEVGRKAREHGIRIVVHPDQYVVLNSDSPRVVENSLSILEHHARLFDRFGLPRTSWAAINIHGGKSGKPRELVEAIGQLGEGARARLTLENDERAYGAAEILEVCREAGVPMVFDAHHHVVKERLPSFEDESVRRFVERARATWPRPEWQIVHLSNGREGLHDSRHHELVLEVPSSYLEVPWIEVEAKHKELAIAQLRECWPVAR
jgi:UV DNA damage endonuclease